MALTDNLVLCMEMESGALTTDASGSNTAFTNNNTVTSVSGKVNNGAHFVATSTQWLSHAANSNFDMASNTKFTIAAWVKLTDVSANYGIVARGNIAGSNVGYLLTYYAGAHNAFILEVSSDGSFGAGYKFIKAATFGTPTAGVYNFVVAYYDGVNIGISVNGGTVDSTAFSAGTYVGTGNFTVGSWNDSPFWYMNGDIDQLCLWQRAIGATDTASMYNSGNGLSYAAMVGGAAPAANIVPLLMSMRRRMAA